MRSRQQGDCQFVLSIHFTGDFYSYVGATRATLPGSFNKFIEDGLRKLIFLPPDLGVPLHAESEAIRARVDNRLDYAVGGARDHLKIAPDILDVRLPKENDGSADPTG